MILLVVTLSVGRFHCEAVWSSKRAKSFSEEFSQEREDFAERRSPWTGGKIFPLGWTFLSVQMVNF